FYRPILSPAADRTAARGAAGRHYHGGMFAIMAVTGVDHTGIVASVARALAELDVHILDVSQTIIDNFFTMLLRVEFDEKVNDITRIQQAMEPVEESQNLVIRIQSEALFTAVNEI